MKLKGMIFTVVSLFIIAGIGFGLFKLFMTRPNFAQPPMPITPVTVDKPELRTITDYHEFTGTANAVEQVQIRARIQGYLKKIHFVDGSDIRAGDLLFEIEPDPFQARLDQANALLKSSEAELLRAKLDLKRVQEAVKTNAVSQQQVTTKLAEHDKAEAAVMANKGALAEAEYNLSYTKIHSPIDGRISRRMVDVGNLVGASEQTLLATVVRLQPIYVTFDVSEGLLLEKLPQKSLSTQSAIQFHVGLENEPDYPHQGLLNYMDNTVDADTGTILLRGELPNSDKKILPGMFVRIKVPVGVQDNAILVNERALNTDLSGKYLLLVDKENKVERRPVVIGRQVDQMRVITSGLSPQETYILKGLQFVSPGMEVAPQQAGAQQPDTQDKPVKEPANDK